MNENQDKMKSIYEDVYVAKKFGIDEKYTGNVELRNLLRKKVSKLVYGSVLDIGCGNGLLYPDVKYFGYVGMDISETMLEEFRNRTDKAELVCGSILGIPFKTDSFDTVVCVDVLHHLSSFEEQVEAIRSMLRVARRRVVLEVKTNDLLNPLRRIAKGLFSNAEDKMTNITYTKSNIGMLKRIFNVKSVFSVSYKVDWKILVIEK